MFLRFKKNMNYKRNDAKREGHAKKDNKVKNELKQFMPSSDIRILLRAESHVISFVVKFWKNKKLNAPFKSFTNASINCMSIAQKEFLINILKVYQTFLRLLLCLNKIPDFRNVSTKSKITFQDVSRPF